MHVPPPVVLAGSRVGKDCPPPLLWFGPQLKPALIAYRPYKAGVRLLVGPTDNLLAKGLTLATRPEVLREIGFASPLTARLS